MSVASKKGRKQRPIGWWIFRVMAGFELAIICLLLLFAATFFGTLEQTQVGLYQTLRKYFDMEALFIIPRLHGKIIPLPLPGTFWVCSVLFVNMTLGGLVRARKGWKTAGVLISHFGILFMLVAGGVSQLKKQEGVMHIFQGDRSNYARSYTEPTIEIYTYDEMGGREEPYVVATEHFNGLDADERLTIRLPDLPFDLLVTGFHRSSELRTTSFGSMAEVRVAGKALADEAERWREQLGRAQKSGMKSDSSELKVLKENAERASKKLEDHEAEFDGVPRIVDRFFLRGRPRVQQEENNLTGCYVTVQDKEGNDIQEVILHYNGLPFPTEVTANVEGKRYGFSLTRWIWPMPFEVELHKTMGEYWPGTRDPSWFQSNITKVEEGEIRQDYEIVMNKPMRHGGITLYQASWAPPMPGGRPNSGFAIVENPSDQWPKWALYVATFGLLVHFGQSLIRFLMKSVTPKTK